MAILSTNDIKQILRITLFWIGVSIMQFLLVYATLLEIGVEFTQLYISPWVGIRTSIIGGLLSGIMGGTIIVVSYRNWLRSAPYGEALLKIMITYTVIFGVVMFTTTIYFQAEYFSLGLGEKELWVRSFDKLFDYNKLIPYVFWLIITLITLISLLVDDKYGPGVFSKFLLGKYFHPHREERIFMFLDLRGSTQIAEKLGETNYFNFLKRAFQVITPAVLSTDGEIYQYVGDEMVISWTIKEGLDKGNCINCFFGVQQSLKKRESEFLEDYGIAPEFKAGLHMGNVMSGEIGVVKREIAYSGDVLNTTARIQSKCNEFGVDILISDALMQNLPSETIATGKSLGFIPLRGKEQDLELFTL